MNSKETPTRSTAWPAECLPQKPGLDNRPVEGHEADWELALLAKAVAHPVRVQIARILSYQQTCMYGELAQRLPLAQSTISQHLKILKEAGLVRGEVDGPRVCYCINPRNLRRLKALVAAL